MKHEKELLENIIPFWEKYSIDRQHGGFYSCLERDGSIYDGMKQLWMQWREVYMFAALYNSAYSRPEFLNYAMQGFNFAIKHGKRTDGLYYLTLNADGSPLGLDENGAALFVESFAAIACAELYRATREERFRKEALDAFQNYWKRVDAATQPLPGNPKRVMFAHTMIGLNVANVMNAAGIPYDSAPLADKVFTFCNPEYGIIFERRCEDGTFELDRQDGRIVNPGHALEGMVFIFEYLKQSGNSNSQMLSKALDITRKTLVWGWDDNGGGIKYVSDFKGLPAVRNEYMCKAWWPQNEAALAAMMAWQATGEQFYMDWFEKIDDFAWENLRDPEFGEWFAYAPLNGVRFHTYKGSRWKGFFHIPRYLLKMTELSK